MDKCSYACGGDCTLVGHAYKAIQFLNECLEHGIVQSAVEGDPKYTAMNLELAKLSMHLLRRIGERK